METLARRLRDFADDIGEALRAVKGLKSGSAVQTWTGLAADVYRSQFFTLHRHPELRPDPDRFGPERFTGDEAAKRPRNVYQPFGNGPRHCIGKHFALTELLVATAMLAQNHHGERPRDNRR